MKDVATGQPLSALVKNEGILRASGGRVELTAAAARHVVDSVINTSGIIEANSVGMKNGQIVLSAATADTKGDAPRQTVRVSGSLSAAGIEQGHQGRQGRHHRREHRAQRARRSTRRAARAAAP